MEGFDREHVPQNLVNKCIADLTLEKYTHAQRAEWYEKLAEVRQRNIKAADDELKAAKEELADIKEKLDAANKWNEGLRSSNDNLYATVSRLTTENKCLKAANETLKAFPGNIRVVNIVTEFIPKKPLRTTVFWGDGKPTTVTLAKGDTADPYTAFCAAFAKKFFGSTHAVRKLVEEKRTIVCFDEGVKDEPDA